MASIYDEIRKIKKQGNEYDKKMMENPEDFMADGFDMRTVNTASRAANQNLFTGDRPGMEGFGTSQYDTSVGTQDLDYRSLEDLRASDQGALPQLTNNLINAGTIAGTTFADSFIGTAAGLVHMWTDSDVDPNLSVAERRLNSFVQNPVSIWLDSINKGVKEAMPTYTSDKYRENRENGEWYKNIFTPEFMGETVLENSGFMAGMVLSGKLSGTMINKIMGSASKLNIIEKGVKEAIKTGKFTGTVEEGLAKALAGKLPVGTMDKALISSAKSLRNINTTNKIVSTALATTGEARLEGIHSADEFSEENKAALESPEGQQELLEKTLNQLYERNPEMFVGNPNEGNPLESIHPDYLANVQDKFEQNYTAAMESIDTASKRVATFSFAVNYPALLASNAIQFSKTFGGSYGRQKGFRRSLKDALHGNASTAMEGVERVVGEAGKMTVKKLPWYKKVGRIMTNPITEANEEMMQSAGQASAEIYAESLMALQFDPDAQLESISAFDAIVKGMVETYTDIKSYEEGFSGFLMGAFGSPNITLSKNAKGKINVFDGGIWGDVKAVKQETQDLQEAVDAMNNRVNSPEFQKMYKAGHSRRILDNLKEGALDNGDEVAYNNMEHTQFIQDMLLYEDLGKLEEFKEMIQSNIDTYNTEDIAEIEELAEELRTLGTNQETGVSMYKEGESAQDIVKEALEHNKDLKANLDKYLSTSKNLRDLLGGRFEGNEEMSEMILLMSHAERIDADYDETINNLKETLQKANKHSNDLTKFPILLQGEQQELTFAEILDSATPTELIDWIVGTSIADISGAKEIGYVQMLLSSTPQLASYEESLIATVKRLQESSREGLTQEQQLEQIAQMNNALKMIDTLKDVFKDTPYRSEIIKDFNKAIQLESTRSKLVNAYNQYAGNPLQLTEKIKEQETKAQEKLTRIQNEDFTNKVKEAMSVQEVRELVQEHYTTHGKVPQSILNNLGTKDSKEFSSVVAEYNRIESMESDIATSPTYTGKPSWIQNGVMQLWNMAKKRANSVNEAYAPTILADDLNALVGEAGEAITQEDRETIRDAFIETMADLQGKESKSTSIIPTPKTPKTVDTPTPEVAEFGGDSKDTGRKRSRPTNAAERRKEAREARATEKAQEAQDAGDLGTPVNSIELFPGDDSSQQNTQQSSPQTENNTEAKEADVERRRQEELDERISYIPYSRKQETEGEHEWQRKNAKEFNNDIRQGLISNISAQQLLVDDAKKEGDKDRLEDKNKDLQEAKDDLKIFDEINAKYDAEIADLNKIESPTTNASKSNAPIQDSHIPLTPAKQATNNSKAIDTIVEEEGKGTTNKETVWTPGTFEIDIDEYRATKQFKDNGNSPRSRIFKKAVEFLKDKGAWDYINSGKVKVNDKITLLASQEYWDHLDSDNDRGYGNNAKPLLWVKQVSGNEVNGNTIEHNGKHYQVLGTFTTNNNPSLHSKIINGYDAAQRTHIDSDISTTIKDVQFGRTSVSEGKQNDLKDIASTTPWGENTPLRLGVSLGGGAIETNGLSVNVIPISSDANDAGQVYILVPGANGEHLPMALTARSVAEMQKNKASEMNDPNNTFFTEFNKALDKVTESFKIEDADARSQAFNASIGYLMNFVHVGSESNIGIHLNESSDFTDIKIQNRETGRTVRFEVGTAELANTETYQAEAEVLKEMILNALGETGTYFQINKNNINGNWRVTGESYNTALKNSGILYSDIDANHVRGANFTMNPMDSNFKEVTPKAPVKPTPTPITSNRVSEGISVTYNNSLYTIEASGDVLGANKNKVTNAKTVGFVKIQHLVDKMSPTEKAENQVDFGSLNTNSLTTTAKTGWVVTNSKGTKYLWDGSKLITDKALVSKAVALVESRKVPASVQIDNWFHGKTSSTTKQIPNNITEITEFEGTKIEYVEGIKSKDGLRHVGAQNVGKGEKIRVDLKKMREIYDNKSWATTVNSDPLHKDAFKSFEEFMMFTFLHEKAHESISKNSGESTKEYETRINNEAMRRMESEYGIVMPKLDNTAKQEAPQPVQETSTPVEVEVRAIEREKQPIPNRPDALYLSGLDGATFNIADSSSDGAYFRIYDINGDTAKYEYSGEDDYAIARRVVTNNNAEIYGSPRTASFINTEKAGTVKRNSDGSWTIVEKASIILGPTRAAKEASTPVTTRESSEQQIPSNITESVDLDQSSKTDPPARKARRGGMQVNTAASIGRVSNQAEGSGTKVITPAEVQNEINENREFHRKNCNGIKPR